MAHGEKNLHALMFPSPHQGHVTPAIKLALKLASEGFTITFVNIEYVHKLLSKAHNQKASEFDLFYEARKSGLNIRYTTISDGLPDDFDRVVRMLEFYDHMLTNFQPIMDEFVGEIIRSDPNSKYFLIADTGFLWQVGAAEKYKLVHVSFWTQPALVFSLCYNIDLLRERGHYPLKDTVQEKIDYIPGIQSLSPKDFIGYYKELNFGGTVWRLLSTAFDLAHKADFVLHNTVQELESSTLLALNKYQPNYAIGPTNFYKNLVNQSLWTESSCTTWLESKAPGSVLYVSFGSVAPTSKQVVEEIAYGLLLSQVNFIWVTRDGVEGSDLHILPAGFRDLFKDRGLIVPWCNQIMVLSDPTVGGFLTHCGWNSITESIWYRVPMLCYPLDYDQPTNRKLVVDDWKVGLNLCDEKTVNRKEVCQKIKSLMTGNQSKDLIHRITYVREMLQNAVESNGSSERNIKNFLIDLKEKLAVVAD